MVLIKASRGFALERVVPEFERDFGGSGTPVEEGSGSLMLYHLLPGYADVHIVFNLFRFITFRAAGALVTALLLAFVTRAHGHPGY